MLNIQNYKKVESIEEAYELNQKKANRIIGGMIKFIRTYLLTVAVRYILFNINECAKIK